MHDHAGDGWNATDLEVVGACPACDGADRHLVHDGLHDRLHPDHPGSWRSWRCAHCSSVYVDPRPTSHTIGRTYENYYTHEGEGSGEREPSGWRARLLEGYLHRRFGYSGLRPSMLGVIVISLLPGARAMASQHVRHLRAPGPTGGRLLDVGCAAGGFLLRMQRLGWDVVGVEPDPQSRAVAQGRGLRVLADMDTLIREEERFDAITLSHSIEHMHHPVEELRRCKALLGDAGVLWVATPNAAASGHRRYGPWWAPLDPPRHLVLFTPSSLALALRRAGLPGVEWPPATLQASSWIYPLSVAFRLGRSTAGSHDVGWRDRLAALRADARTAIDRSRGEEVVAVGHCHAEEITRTARKPSRGE